MSEATEMLREFHAALGDELGRGNAKLRWTLHEEEGEELLDELAPRRLGIGVREPKADEDVDRAHLARELADVVYVTFGTAHAFDIDLDAALAEIHRAAMSKLDPATMRVRDDGKILKPEGFIPPDMSQAIGGEA
jgi:NTP pyrophosphatase (non-canonical NTP hydrolase)